jgi:Zn-dependent peptidase ImmA (M78 family)/transcriptional regulator with XRE-family HTH domain
LGITVKGDVLRWAREERRLTPAEAAKRLRLSEPDLATLEAGNPELSVTTLRNIAKKYEMPFATLLMPAPLPASTRPKVKDFRTHGGKHPELDNPMIVELEDVNAHLDLMADLREDSPELFRAIALPHVGFSGDADVVAEIAAVERRRFQLPLERQFAVKPREFFLMLRAKVEAQGVFVYARNLGAAKNCRGFTLIDERALPAAVINSTEGTYGAKTFTIMHEYAHVLLREAGISDENRSNVVEKFCNRFAAHFLMPMADFKKHALQIRRDRHWTEHDLAILANKFSVSKSATALHLEDADLVRRGFYDALKAEWKKRSKKATQGRATHPEKMVNKLGVRHIQIVFRAYDAGHINKLDAYELLDVSPQYFESVRREARDRQAKYGGAG